MNSQAAAPDGRPPRVRHAPRSVSNDADDAVFLAAGYGLTPFDWQEDVLEDWLGRRADGRWSAKTCGLAVPRQNGKNALLEIRELFGMVVLGEKFLHTAHEVKTARKAFLRIASFFENPRQYPEMARLVKEIRKTNGQEAVVLDNGGSVEFIARSRGSGRGFTVDVLVCDEAQDLTDEEIAALLPTTSAAPTGNPQFILTGTPPDPEKGQKGEVFARVRRDAEAKRDRRLAWADYGVEDGPLPDVDNRELWLRHNPSMPVLIGLDEVIQQHTVMSPEAFARERLGWWGDPDALSTLAFGPGRWEACRVDDLQPVVFAVGAAVAFDRQMSSIAVAGLRGEQLILGTFEGARRAGSGWLVPELFRLQEEYGCMVVVDEKGPTSDLIPAMKAAGINVTTLNTSQVADACSSLFTRVQDGLVSHPGHPDLDEAVAHAAKRDVGDGRWAWARKKSSGDISMLESATYAAWVAGTAATPTVW